MKFKSFSTKQKQILTWWHPDSPVYDKEVIICDGAIRAGKTVPMSLSYVFWAMENFERCNFGMAGKTIGSFKRNVWLWLKPALIARGYKIRKLPEADSPNAFVISRKGVQNYFYIFGGKDEQSQNLVQGITLAGMLFDEVALMPESFVNQAVGRCSIEFSRIWFNCNPEGPFHWFKVGWIDKLEAKNAVHIHFLMEDNPSLSDRIKQRYLRMFTGIFFKRYIQGKWAIAEGAIYDMFDESRHIIQEKDIPKAFDRMFVCIDYGTSNPTAFLKVGELGPNIYVIDEYYWNSQEQKKQKTDAQYSRDLQKFIGDDPIQAIVIDPSAASFIAQLKTDGLVQIKRARNDVLDGIRSVSTFLSEGRLYISRKCNNTLEEFTAYAWDPKAQARGEDKPLKQSDHAMDALRYLIHTLFRTRFRGVIDKPKGI